MRRCSHCGLDHAMDEPICPITEESLHEPGPCGTSIDRYEVERWLGGGGFGAVYRARHAVMDRTVALKLLHRRGQTTSRAQGRFFQEAKAAAAIGHPNIVQIFDAGSTPEGTAFLAMELIDGCSLFELLAVENLPVRRSLEIVLSVLDALTAAHQVGIIHRDVKPGNIMLAGTEVDGSRTEDRVKLVDFGISKVRSHLSAKHFTRSNASLGSPGYAAPEQYVSARDVDVRADVYSVGVVLYRLLSGELPFDADSYEQMIVQVCTEDAPRIRTKLPELPPALGMAIDRALSRRREERHESASALANELRTILDEFPEESSHLRPDRSAAEVATAPIQGLESPKKEPNLIPRPKPAVLEVTAPAGTWGLSELSTSEPLSSPRRRVRWRRRVAFAGAIIAMMAGGARVLWSMDHAAHSSGTRLASGTSLAEPRQTELGERTSAEVQPSEASPLAESEPRTLETGRSEAGASISRAFAPSAVTASEASVETRSRSPSKARVVRRRQDSEAARSAPEVAQNPTTTHRSGFGAEDLEPF